MTRMSQLSGLVLTLTVSPGLTAGLTGALKAPMLIIPESGDPYTPRPRGKGDKARNRKRKHDRGF